MSTLEMTDDISWTKGESDDWMIESGYEEIYNGEGRTPGEAREHDGETGRFYQTYGNGGGPGGWGGYWIQDGRKSVWQVEGEVFTWLPTKRLHIMGVPYFPCSIHWWCKVVCLTLYPTS